MQHGTIEAALEHLTARVMSIPGVVGTAVGLCDGRPCVKVFLARRSPAALRQIPAVIEGFPVSVEESGEFRART